MAAPVELTAAQAADLSAAQTLVDQLRLTIDRMEASGLDVAELRARLERAETVRSGLLRNFTPGATGRRQGRP
jgi:hypothetical protein